MTGPAGDGRRALGPDDRLIAAWVAWDRNPTSRGAVAERLAAIEAAGLPALETQFRVARNRSRGMSIPDAVMTAVNDGHQDDDRDCRCTDGENITPDNSGCPLHGNGTT